MLHHRFQGWQALSQKVRHPCVRVGGGPGRVELEGVDRAALLCSARATWHDVIGGWGEGTGESLFEPIEATQSGFMGNSGFRVQG